MNRPLLTAIILTGCVLPLTPASRTTTIQERRARQLLAGAATSNITPPLGELIVGNWTPVPATYVHDELHARCLVLDDGEIRMAIVVADNVGIPRRVLDEAKRLIHVGRIRNLAGHESGGGPGGAQDRGHPAPDAGKT